MSTTKRDDRAQERAIDKTIDETKESARKVLSEVKRELPEVTSAFHDYQEQNINDIRDMTKRFLESQKEIAKSMQAAAGPYTNNILTLMFFPWLHPQLMADAYVRSVSNVADATVAAARLSSDMMQVGLQTARSSIEAARNQSRT